MSWKKSLRYSVLWCAVAFGGNLNALAQSYTSDPTHIPDGSGVNNASASDATPGNELGGPPSIPGSAPILPQQSAQQTDDQNAIVPPTGPAPVDKTSKNWVMSQATPGWLFLAGPLRGANPIIRLEDRTTAGQMSLFCTKAGEFELAAFPTSPDDFPTSVGAQFKAMLEIAGTTKEVDFVSTGGDHPGYLATGRAVPAILQAISGVPEGKAEDINLTIGNFAMVTGVPEPRSPAVMAANICGIWYDAAYPPPANPSTSTLGK